MCALALRPARDADAPTILAIRYAAFASGPISRCLFCGQAPSEGEQARALAALLEELQEPRNRFVVAERESERERDGEGGPTVMAVVAAAKWVFYETERTRDEWDRPPPAPAAAELGDGVSGEMMACLAALGERRKTWVRGRAHYLLSNLITAPDHQRLGAGSALLRWGTDRADAAGLECWLEATPQGYPLYRSMGFEDVDVQETDLQGRFAVERAEGEDWGAGSAKGIAGELREGWFRTAIMRRKAGGPDGEGNGVVGRGGD